MQFIVRITVKMLVYKSTFYNFLLYLEFFKKKIIISNNTENVFDFFIFNVDL